MKIILWNFLLVQVAAKKHMFRLSGSRKRANRSSSGSSKKGGPICLNFAPSGTVEVARGTVEATCNAQVGDSASVNGLNIDNSLLNNQWLINPDSAGLPSVPTSADFQFSSEEVRNARACFFSTRLQPHTNSVCRFFCYRPLAEKGRSRLPTIVLIQFLVVI